MIKNHGGLPRPRLASEPTRPIPPEDDEPLTLDNVGARARALIAGLPAYPDTFRGRGVVICGGGRYFASAYVLVRMLRQQGCGLPIELWHLGEAELSARMRALVAPFGVVCVDAWKVRETHPMRHLNGWELKAYALRHSAFEEVLLLDADNLPVMDPTYLFETPQYRQGGAIFWPDIYRRPGEHSFQPAIWQALGLEVPVGLPEFESAQLVVHKRLAWRPLELCVWLNAYSDFIYQHVYGDKETFNLAWRMLRAPFAMPSMHIHHLRHTLCQRDFAGQRLFQHRCAAKFELRHNLPEEGFLLESDCLIYLAELALKWDGRIGDVPKLDFTPYAPPALQSAAASLLAGSHHYVRVGYDERPLEFLQDGTIGDGAAFYEQFWALQEKTRADGHKEVWLTLSSPVKRTCELVLEYDGVWRGKWEHSGEMFVELR